MGSIRRGYILSCDGHQPQPIDARRACRLQPTLRAKWPGTFTEADTMLWSETGGKDGWRGIVTLLTTTLAIPVSQWDSICAFSRLDLSLTVCGMPPLAASKNVFTSAKSSLAKDNKRMSLLLIYPEPRRQVYCCRPFMVPPLPFPTCAHWHRLTQPAVHAQPLP